eukprot:3955765-Amphidinium_carterae.1
MKHNHDLLFVIFLIPVVRYTAERWKLDLAKSNKLTATRIEWPLEADEADGTCPSSLKPAMVANVFPRSGQDNRQQTRPAREDNPQRVPAVGNHRHVGRGHLMHS